MVNERNHVDKVEKHTRNLASDERVGHRVQTWRGEAKKKESGSPEDVKSSWLNKREEKSTRLRVHAHVR